jgi:hypothetical protein
MPNFYKLFFICLLLFVLLPPLVLVYAQNNPNCLNYTIGLGEMEIGMTVNSVDQYTDYLLKDNYLNKNSKLFLPIGWDIVGGWINFDNKKVEMIIDRDTYLSGQGSLKIQINKEAGRDFGTTFGLRNLMTIPAHDDDTYPYYPQPGDQLVTKFYLKTPQVNNIRVNYRIIIHYHPTSSTATNPTSTTILSSVLNLTPTNNFEEYSFATTIPSTIGYLRQIDIRFEFRHGNSSTAESQLLTYLDKFEMYTYSSTTNQCKTFPYHLRQNSSLKFFEIYPLGGPNDSFNFIRAYKDNTKIHIGSPYIWSLNLKKLDPDFKYFEYYGPAVVHRWYHNTTNSNIYIVRPRKVDFKDVARLFDDLWVVATGTPQSTSSQLRKTLAHPNSRYSDFIVVNSRPQNSPYHYHTYIQSYTYVDFAVNKRNNQVRDFWVKHYTKIPRFLHKNSQLGPDGLFIDNIWYDVDRHRDYKNLTYVSIYFKELYSKIFPYYSLIGNLGSADADPDSSLTKFVKGYMNEGWLINPNNNNFWQATSSSDTNNPNIRSVHDSFNRVLSNYKLNQILLVTHYPDQCTTTNATLTAITAAAYLANNPNVYFAFVLGGPNRYSDAHQCQTDLMYLPLGSPLSLATNVNQITVASTSSGYLYSRLYENGRVFFNSSDVTLTFTLSTSTEINGKTFYIDPVNNNLSYNFSTTSLNINIGPKQGLILYTPTSSQNNQEAQLDQDFY